jgi:Ca2+-binding RTX toxin-like protein
MITLSLLGGVALAATAVGHGSGPSSGSTIFGYAIYGSTDDNDIRISHDPSVQQYVITDQAGIVGCTTVDARTVRCDGPTNENHFEFTGNGGDDRLVVDQSVAGELSAVGSNGDDHLEIIKGGTTAARFQGWFRGRDRLIGASGDDFLTGGADADHLVGRSGDDRLSAGLGRDHLRAGPGDDELHAGDGRADAEIRCGGGHDVLVLDNQADPRPHGCEEVFRKCVDRLDFCLRLTPRPTGGNGAAARGY